MRDLEQQRRHALLAWYDCHRRVLPWRAAAGVAADPYRVWLSEIMLQQTTVGTVESYFRTFTERWPTLQALAGAELDDILHAWQGLGYYARARNLHKCAMVIASEYDGCFPDSEQELLKLPGIGFYTAAAIVTIAFNRRAAPVDGNIERVFARLMLLGKPSPSLRTDVAAQLLSLVPEDRPGDFVQALMDLGSGVCTPTKPNCADCPWLGEGAGGCRAFVTGQVDAFPVKKPKKKKPTRRGLVFWSERGDGRVFLRRRGERGLLGGMMEFPSTDWREQSLDLQQSLAGAPFEAAWRVLPGVVKHTFTHFHLELTVCTGRVATSASANVGKEGVWSSIDGLSDYALPTLMKKIVLHVECARQKCII